MCNFKDWKDIQPSGSSYHEETPFTQDAPHQYESFPKKQIIKYLPNKVQPSNHYDKSVLVEDITSIPDQDWKTEQLPKDISPNILKRKNPFDKNFLIENMEITPVTCPCCPNENDSKSDTRIKTTSSTATMKANILIDTIIEMVDTYYKTIMKDILRNIHCLLKEIAYLEHQEINYREEQKSLFKDLISTNRHQVNNMPQSELDDECENIIQQIKKYQLKGQIIIKECKQINDKIIKLYSQINLQGWRRNQIAEKVSNLRDHF